MATKKVIKKAVKAKSSIKPLAVKKPFSKSEIVITIAEMAELGRKQAMAAIESLTHIIKTHLSKKGPGVFVFPDIAKFHLVHKPATKSRKGTNPFTGEPMTFAAKPSRHVVKIRALKKLKEAAK
jgi:nucleoid DNA-binding protein